MHLEDCREAFLAIAPAGFYVALRLGFYSPEEELNAFPEPWVEHYTTNGLAVQDPALRWTFRSHGAARWSEIDIPDPAGVLADYARFDLRFGVTVCIGGSETLPRKSVGIFARSDREMTDPEIAELNRMLCTLHRSELQTLTESQIEVLRLLSTGMRQKEMAYALGISQSAVKARLKSAAQRMRAKTAAQAATIAAARGML